MERSALSLKWLEVFQAVARYHSVREAAAELGLSVSTASHHLACLEQAVGASLVDHAKRPMRLTAEGDILLRRVDEALGLLRKGVSEIWTDDLGTYSRTLRVAHVEDFDADVGPEMGLQLSQALPGCRFSFLSRPSHGVLDLLRSDQADIGIAATSEDTIPGVSVVPLLRDPFVMVAPRDADLPQSAADLEGSGALELLRYSNQQLMGRRIDAQLSRHGISPPGRMEFESTQSILSLVADGCGWTISSALNCARAHRFRDRIQIGPLPAKAFSRDISLFLREDLPAPLRELVCDRLGTALDTLIIGPALDAYPWLAGQFALATPIANGRAVRSGLAEPL